MGQKVKPKGFRLGVINTWDSVWYAGKDYSEKLHQDIAIRKYLNKKLKGSSVSSIKIERSAKSIIVSINTSKPGAVIGKRGAEIENLKKDLTKLVGDEVQLNIVEIRKPELDAALVAESIGQQLSKRIAFRRAMKRAIQSAMRFGAQGIKVRCSGRLGGVDIARAEWYREGKIPLHTLRADIDYAQLQAPTQYGVIGVQVWIYKGEILEGTAEEANR
jgi:small subunit ribosomal protein S3